MEYTTVASAQAAYDNAVAAHAKLQEHERIAAKAVSEAREALENTKRRHAPPVDRSDRTLTDGSPVTDDHRELQPNGQQKGYVVLSEAERAKGFVRPVRDAYRHTGRVICGKSGGRCDKDGQVAERICHFAPGHEGECGKIGWRILNGAEIVRLHETGRLGGCDSVTTMGRSLAETYARDPEFYSGTFCSKCRGTFPGRCKRRIRLARK